MDLLTIVLGWLAPLLIVAYVLWLLTRLTQTVERIEWRLARMEGPAEREDPAGRDGSGQGGQA